MKTHLTSFIPKAQITKTLRIVISIFVLLLAASSSSHAQLSFVGSDFPDTNPSVSTLPSIKFHPITHEAYIAHSIVIGGAPYISVKRYDCVSNQWLPVGSNVTNGVISSSLERGQNPVLAFHPTTHDLYVAYSSGRHNYDVVVRKLQGTNWQPPTVLGQGSTPRITSCLVKNRVYVSFSDLMSGRLEVHYTSGSHTWNSYFNSLVNGNRVGSYHDIATHPTTGEPYVHISERSIISGSVYFFANVVRLPTPGSYIQAGAAIPLEAHGNRRIVFNSVNIPYISFIDNTNTSNRKGVVLRLDNVSGSWVDAITGSSSSFTAVSNGWPWHTFGVHPHTDDLYFAYQEGNGISVKTTNGTGPWLYAPSTAPGSLVPPLAHIIPYDMDFHPVCGTPHIATDTYTPSGVPGHTSGFFNGVLQLHSPTNGGIAVFGNSSIVSSGDLTPDLSDHTDFGVADLCTNTPITRTFTITNTGSSSLTLTGTPHVSLSGSSDFAITQQPNNSFLSSACVCPAAGPLPSSTTFEVTFTPSSLGGQSATVSIASDDPNTPNYTFDIAATAVHTCPPHIIVQGSSIDIASGDLTPSVDDGTELGKASICDAAIVHTFTIKNTGGTPLTLTGNPLVNIAGSAEFTVSRQPSSSSISAGGNLTFDVAFAPSMNGVRTATVTIPSDASNQALYSFSIQGEGKSYYNLNWLHVGVPQFSAGGRTWHHSLAFHPITHEPYVAYSEALYGHKTHIKRFNGSWVDVGAATGISATDTRYQSLAFNPTNGDAYVAYQDRSTGNYTTVLKAIGGTAPWTTVGASIATPGNNQSLAFSPVTNTPWVAFINENNDEVNLRYFDGTNWQPVPSLGMTNPARNYLELAFEPDTDIPYVAFENPSSHIEVHKLEDNSGARTWASVGLTSSTNYQGTYQSLAFNPSTSVPYVAFKDSLNGNGTTVIEYDVSSATWNTLGGAASAGFSGARADYQSLAFNPLTNEPYVAYQDWSSYNNAREKTTVMRFDNASQSWEHVGAAGFSTGEDEFQSLAFHPTAGRPFVAFQDGGPEGVTVMELTCPTPGSSSNAPAPENLGSPMATLSSIANSSAVNVYPNPAGSIVNIDLRNSGVEGQVSVEVVNILGVTLLQEQLSTDKSTTAQLNLAELPTGVYLIRVTSNKGVFVEKILKETN